MYIKRSYKTPFVEQIYNYKGHVFSWNMLFPQQPIGSIMTLTCLHENSALAQQPPPPPCIFFRKTEHRSASMELFCWTESIFKRTKPLCTRSRVSSKKSWTPGV